MKKIILLAVILLSVFLIACTSNRFDGPRQGMRDRFQNNTRFENMTDEERQQQFEDTQAQMIELCKDNVEGESCTFESPRGNITGQCLKIDGKMICQLQQPPINQERRW